MIKVDDVVFNPVDINSDCETLKSEYDRLLSGALYARAVNKYEKVPADWLNSINKNIYLERAYSIICKQVDHILRWLENSTDFYTCPASTKYHDSHPSGLLKHSLNVYNQMLSLLELPQFKGKVNVADATLVALVHDWCKIGRYETYYRNVKNDQGVWEQVASYKTTQSNMGRLGHGVQSLTMLMQVCTHPLMTLSFEEMAAIRWHMGVYQVSDPERDDLFRCNDMIPMVLLIQFADQLSITNYANE